MEVREKIPIRDRMATAETGTPCAVLTRVAALAVLRNPFGRQADPGDDALDGDPTRGPGDLDLRSKSVDPADEEHDVARLGGGGGATCANGDADVGRSERGRVISLRLRRLPLALRRKVVRLPRPLRSFHHRAGGTGRRARVFLRVPRPLRDGEP